MRFKFFTLLGSCYWKRARNRHPPFWVATLNLDQSQWTKGDYQRGPTMTPTHPKRVPQAKKQKTKNQQPRQPVAPKNYVCVCTRSSRPKIIVKGRVRILCAHTHMIFETNYLLVLFFFFCLRHVRFGWVRVMVDGQSGSHRPKIIAKDRV